MKVFAISDLHLSLNGEKPMDIFGFNWKDYLTKIKEDWQSKVSNDDIVLISGDISWAMQLEDALKDIGFFATLNGTKIINTYSKRVSNGGYFGYYSENTGLIIK